VHPFRVATSRHEPTGELVDDHHLAVLHDVLYVLLVQRVRLKELSDVVDGLALLRVFPLQRGPPLRLLLLLHVDALVDLVQELREVRDDEQLRVLRGDPFPAQVREVGVVPLLVHREEQRFVQLVHPLLAHEVGLDLLDQLLDSRLVEQLHQPLVLGHPALGLEQPDTGLVIAVLVAVLPEELLGFGHELIDDARLLANEPLHQRLELAELAGGVVLSGARDDERGSRLVDQHRVDLVHDRVMMTALDTVLGKHGHVVAEIIEAELVVRPVGDVAGVGLAALLERHVVLDHAHVQPQPAQDLPHPLRVAARQIVVHGNEVGTSAF
jgi:hypothetical protein